MAFTHIDAAGDAVMVDIGGKAVTQREARVAGRISMSAECFAMVRDGAGRKGDVLGVAQVAGILAAKRAWELIPLCHALQLTHCQVRLTLHPEDCSVSAECAARCEGKTGAEMEALVGASVALLTVYDMCKALDKRMVIGEVRLVEKTGGESGHFQFEKRDDPN